MSSESVNATGMDVWVRGERLRSWARWLVFPAIMGGAIAGTIIALPYLGPSIAAMAVLTVGLVAVASAERLLPFRPEWNRSHGAIATDATHALVSGLGVTQLMAPLVAAGGVALAGLLSHAIGGSVWPVTWPLVAQLGLALLVAELPQYWVHRWQHEHEILWHFHATHHSAPRLYWLNAARFHPGDLGLLYSAGFAPLAILGCPAEVIALFAVFDGVFGMLQHGNVDVRLGPLNWIFSMAEPHRWHHSQAVDEANTNYGSNLIVWDHVFGTFFLPRDRPAPATIGIADMPRFPSSYRAQILSPFRWQQVKRESAATIA